MKTSYKLIASICLAATYLENSIPVSAADLPRQKVVLARSEGLQHISLDLARAAGFFEQEGIDLDSFTVSNGTTQSAALAAGDIDIAPTSLLQVIKFQAQGGDVIVVANLFDAMPLNIVLSHAAITKADIVPGMTIDEKIKRLKGLTIAISGPGASTDIFARSLFLARGLNPDDYVRLQPIGDGPASYAALQRKLVDGFSNGPPWIEVAQSAGLAMSVVDPMSGEVPELSDVPYDFLVTSRRILANKPTMIAAVMRAIARSIHLIQQDPTAAQKIRQYFPSVPDDVIFPAIESVRRGVPKSPVITRVQFDKTLTWMNIGAKDPIKARFEDVVENGPAQQAEAGMTNR